MSEQEGIPEVAIWGMPSSGKTVFLSVLGKKQHQSMTRSKQPGKLFLVATVSLAVFIIIVCLIMCC